jgi:hypothetical protein
MADNKKKELIICWNKSAYTEEIARVISSDYTSVVCTDFDQFEKKVVTEEKKGEKKSGSGNNRNEAWKDVKGIIVLCELVWNHAPKSNGSLSDLKGITLVQQYIRKDRGIKIPVVFVSFLARKRILELRHDAKIILTPALQHGYEQLPVKKWLDKLEQMQAMTDVELEFTKLKYCDIEGLVRSAKHDVEGVSNAEDFQKLYNTLKYVVEKKHPLCAGNLAKIGEFNDASKKQIIRDFQSLCSDIIDNPI